MNFLYISGALGARAQRPKAKAVFAFRKGCFAVCLLFTFRKVKGGHVRAAVGKLRREEVHIRRMNDGGRLVLWRGEAAIAEKQGSKLTESLKTPFRPA